MWLALLATSVLCSLFSSVPAQAQGWPQDYSGVMLQGFYWDSYIATQWKRLEEQAEELATTFSLVWIPQSGYCGGDSMGYDDLYWFNQNSTFGSETELRSLIKTFNAKGIGTIADVVINHRKNLSNWVDFPSETYKGVTYELLSTDICADDDGDETKKWADKNGYALSSNGEGKDEATGKDCEDWGGMRDLDHSSSNVQNNVKAYLGMLINDLGYAGFRYDMVKGYASKYTGMYNAAAAPTYSVGEYWDGNASTVKKWIDGTKVDGMVQSAAFDFAFRYTVRNALRGSADDENSQNWKQDADFRLLGNASIASDANYSRYAVTFVENHDTERRSDAEQDPLRKDTLAANAYLLAMPGTPCVFFKHWKAYKQEIANMVAVRKAVGITNTSSYLNMASTKNYYVVRVTGTNGKMLLAVVGTGAGSYTPSGSGWKKAISGYHYAYYVSGIEPENIAYHTFEQTTFKPYTITVGVNVDKVGWTGGVNFWTWGGDGSHSPQNTTWPGDKVTSTVVVGGKTWYTRQYTINNEDDGVSFVFSTGTGSPQTVDKQYVYEDKFFEVSTDKEGSKYKVDDVTSSYTGITPLYRSADDSAPVYDLQGRRLNTSPSRKGIYIKGGKKVIVGL